MTINGIQILTSQIIYKPANFSILIIFLILGIMALFLTITNMNKILDCILAAVSICIIFIIFVLSTLSIPTFLNKPDKIEYTIEVLDDNAWKEIGPNYIVKEKVYENKEIYIIEGDYIE